MISSSTSKEVTQDYKKQQIELNRHILLRQNLLVKLNENKLVQEQFSRIEHLDQHQVYKSISNVLLRQDFNESKSIVNRRIDFLRNECSRIEKKIESIQASMEELRERIVAISKQPIETHSIKTKN